VRQRLTVLAVPGIDDLDVRAGVSGNEFLSAHLVDHHDIGLSEVRRSADGQESGVTRAGTDKGDAGRVTGGLSGR